MGRKPVVGKCRLCLQYKQLVDSHIIPDFHFKPLKEEDGYFYRLSTDSKKKELKSQRGFTENLLCAVCDNERLQKNEVHLAHVLFESDKLHMNRTGPFLTFRGYDYKKVKNGLLSVLWRMSISTRPEFNEVDLGAKHEETIRLALLNDTAFAEEQYPIMVTAPLVDGQFRRDMILAPDSLRVRSNRAYRCLISGLLFTFFIGSGPLDATARPFILRVEAWPIYVAPVESIPFLHDAFIRLAQSKAARRNA